MYSSSIIVCNQSTFGHDDKIDDDIDTLNIKPPYDIEIIADFN
jgi:hypothetical protein